MIEEPASVRTVDLYGRITSNTPSEISYSGDKGIKLIDVYEEKASLEEFLGQLSDEDLERLIRGEGMCSPRVTAGTASAFGGVSDSLCDFGVPAACCADGPSGIRMDCGTQAFSLPNGTSLACTFNTELVGVLFDMLGQELYNNRIDTLLGPGLNIHRTPLNGCNFEYFSEDPLLTGKMAAVQIRAMNKYKVTGTIMDTTKGTSTIIGLHTKVKGRYAFFLKLKASGGELAQVPVTIFLNNILISTITITGTDEWQTVEKILDVQNNTNFIKFYFGQSGMKLGHIAFYFSFTPFNSINFAPGWGRAMIRAKNSHKTLSTIYVSCGCCYGKKENCELISYICGVLFILIIVFIFDIFNPFYIYFINNIEKQE